MVVLAVVRERDGIWEEEVVNGMKTTTKQAPALPRTTSSTGTAMVQGVDVTATLWAVTDERRAMVKGVQVQACWLKTKYTNLNSTIIVTRDPRVTLPLFVSPFVVNDVRCTYNETPQTCSQHS